MTVTMNKGPLIAAVRKAAQRGVMMGTEVLRTEVLRLILQTPHTGRIYQRPGDVEHQASAPGETPASDTGRLVNSIRTEYQFDNPSRVVGIVNASTNYASYLEYGTEKMEPRPFMRPALSNKKLQIQMIVQNEVNKALSTAFGKFGK